MRIILRDATPGDAAAISEIYAHEVLHGTSSYESDAPSPGEMARRMAAGAASQHPWLVAIADGVVVGYAYASAFRARPAYRWTVENSVYVREGCQRRGIGARLLNALIERCTSLGYRQMIAVIGDAGNTASIELHARAGFRVAARFPGIGWKLGRWLTGVQMQRALGQGDAVPPFATPDATP